MSDEQKSDQKEATETEGDSQSQQASGDSNDHVNHKEKVEGCEFC